MVNMLESDAFTDLVIEAGPYAALVRFGDQVALAHLRTGATSWKAAFMAYTDVVLAIAMSDPEWLAHAAIASRDLSMGGIDDLARSLVADNPIRAVSL